MSKALLTSALALALLLCAEGARAQRVGPLDEDTGAAGDGAKPAAEKAREAKPEAKAKKPDAAATADAKPAAKAEAKATAAEEKRDHTSPPPAGGAPASGDARPANNPAANKSAAADSPPSATPLGEKTAAPASSGSAGPADAPSAHEPAPAATPLGGGAAVGSLPTPPKYEPPQPLRAEVPSNSSAADGGANISAAATAASSALSPTAIYRVGAGDILDIRLVGGMSKDYTLFTVLSNGTIDYPLAGEPVSVLNLTPEEIGARLTAALKRRGIFDRAQFQIAVRDYTSHTVLVSGLVDQPGRKVLRRESVPLYVVLAEAFPRADAGRVVVVSRSSGGTKTLDLSDSGALNELVSAGDVINVQPRPQEFYYIAGSVGAPGQKDYHAGLTLTQAILAAGGLSREAGKKTVVVVSRQGADGRLVPAEYALQEIQDGKTPDPRVQPGDRIEVGRRR
jgi:protein involved in polysaccharide export with SLBB domain